MDVPVCQNPLCQRPLPRPSKVGRKRAFCSDRCRVRHWRAERERWASDLAKQWETINRAAAAAAELLALREEWNLAYRAFTLTEIEQEVQRRRKEWVQEKERFIAQYGLR